MNKDSGGDGIPVKLFQIIKDVCSYSAVRNMPANLENSEVATGLKKVTFHSHLFENFPQFIVIHTDKSFGIVNKAEIDVFLELSCFFHDPADVGILISGSSAFSKTSLNIWKFTVHILLKPGLENFEHYFTSV